MLFHNLNLHYNLDREEEIIQSIQRFQEEVSGLSSSKIIMTLSGKNQRSYVDESAALQDKEESLLDDGVGKSSHSVRSTIANAVGKVFKPTVSDLKLLIGTKEWPLIIEQEGIDENTVDKLAVNDVDS